jgi:hypothetical protein
MHVGSEVSLRCLFLNCKLGFCKILDIFNLILWLIRYVAPGPKRETNGVQGFLKHL